MLYLKDGEKIRRTEICDTSDIVFVSGMGEARAVLKEPFWSYFGANFPGLSSTLRTATHWRDATSSWSILVDRRARSSFLQRSIGKEIQIAKSWLRREAALAFIDDILQGGGHHVFEWTEVGASRQPASGRGSDLRPFQNLVRKIRDNRGGGYAIHFERISSDLPGDLVDLIVLTLEA